MWRTPFLRLLATVALLAAGPVSAQSLQGEVAPDAVKKQNADLAKHPEGWTHTLSLGATGSFSRSDGVVGTTDGSTVQLGGVVEGQTDWARNRKEWQSTLKYVHLQSRDSVLQRFVKSADQLDVATMGLLRLKGSPWLGPYVRARATTQVFAGYAVKAAQTSVVKIDTDGSKHTVALAPRDRLDLTAPFEPTQLIESAGVFANPWDAKTFRLDARLGVGLQHVLGQGGYAVDDDAKTADLEVKQIRSASQVGADAELVAVGEPNPSLAWKASATAFLPAYSSAAGDTGLSRMTTQLAATLKVKLAAWASLDYTFSARRVPLVVDRWQVQNGILLTTSFTLL